MPVVAEFARRLDLAGIVDRACPVRDLALLTDGQVVEALVANRLTSPTPLVHVEDWAREWAVEEIFGIQFRQRFAIFYTKVHNRLLRPLLAANDPPAPLPVRQALRTLDRTVTDYLSQARITA